MLGLEKGDGVGMVRRRGRIVVEMKEEEKVRKVEKEGKEFWEDVKGVKGVEGVDNWVGMVIPAMSVER